MAFVYMKIAKPVLERTLLDLPDYLSVEDVVDNQDHDDTFILKVEDATGDLEEGTTINPVYEIDESFPSYRLSALDIEDDIDTESDEN